MGEALQATIREHFDNSLENIGRGNSVSPIPPLRSAHLNSPSRTR